MDLEKEFVTMVDTYKRLIYKVCYMYSSKEIESADLFQEVTLNLWKGYPSFRGESKIETWIYRIALNSCITQLRKKSRSPQVIELNSDMDFLYEDNGNSNLAELYNMISHLDALEKAIVLLYLEDRPYEEIASMIGISKTNVGTKLSRIKEKLRKMSNQNEYSYGTR